MNRLPELILLAVTGLISGVVVGAFNTGLVPLCGDPCSMQRLGSSVSWGLALSLVFPVIGGPALRKFQGSRIRALAVAAFLSFLTVLPAAAVYGYDLHRQYWQSTARLGVPNLDFSEMAIATRPIEATLYGGTSSVRVKAWERCALGYANCGIPQGLTVEAICFGSGTTVLIKEKDWPAFQRIPEEDLQGIQNTRRDMRLCAQ
ncbi:hypothetical protein [Telluria beijingensis]|uniref:hypothetical protein n=1 Tax=Telluria beijingensis TaxID=3068633 RepID=UPI002795971C|nr:hypothetical protein [Massilia sp. REN29]